jgi:enterochelin esterase-like enzyme
LEREKKNGDAMFPLGGGETLEGLDFQSYRSQIFDLYNARKYQEAIAVAFQAENRFPERHAKTSYWISCLKSRLGESEEAIQALEEASKKGVWWPDQALLMEPDLEPLQGRPEFKAIVAESQRLKQRALSTAKPGVMVLTPRDSSPEERHPLIIALTMRVGHPGDFAEHWNGALNQEFLLAVPHSSQPISSEEYCWDDPERSERDVAWAYKQIRDKYNVDPDKVIVAGFSQGAALALYLILNRTFPCRGFIAVAMSDWVAPEDKPASQRDRPSEAFASFIRGKDVRGLKGVVIMGEKDAFLSKIKMLLEEMVDRGFNCKIEVVQNLGHEFPVDFERRLESATNFLLS